jgi:serine/threonine protein kinase
MMHRYNPPNRALHVDVTPSSSNGYVPPPNAAYDMVDFREISFPHFQQIKRLGRGSYGTVLQGTFRGSSVAVKLLDKDLDHSHIHQEVCFQ